MQRIQLILNNAAYPTHVVAAPDRINNIITACIFTKLKTDNIIIITKQPLAYASKFKNYTHNAIS